MKKVLVAVAMIMGVSSAAVFAASSSDNVMVEWSYSADEQNIDVKDLPAAIVETVAKEYAGQDIKSATVEVKEGEEKIYKLVLVNAEDAETTVSFNEKGEILK